MAELIDKDKLYKEMIEEYKKIYAGTGTGYDFTVSMQMVQTQPTTTEAEIRAKAIDDFVEHINLPLTTEEDITKILEQLKEE